MAFHQYHRLRRKRARWIKIHFLATHSNRATRCGGSETVTDFDLMGIILLTRYRRKKYDAVFLEFLGFFVLVLLFCRMINFGIWIFATCQPFRNWRFLFKCKECHFRWASSVNRDPRRNLIRHAMESKQMIERVETTCLIGETRHRL